MQLNQSPDTNLFNNSVEENNKVKSTTSKTSKKLGLILGSALALNIAGCTQEKNENQISETTKSIKAFNTQFNRSNNTENEIINEGLQKNGDYIIDFSEQLPKMNQYNNSLQILNSNVPFTLMGNYIVFHVNNYKNIDLEVSVSYIDSGGTYHIKDLSFNDIETLSQSYVVSEELSEINKTNTPWEGSITLDDEINLTRNSTTGSNEYFIEAYYTILNTEKTTETGHISATVNINNKNIIHLQGQTPQDEFIKINIKLKDKFGKTYSLEGLDNIFYLETNKKTED